MEQIVECMLAEVKVSQQEMMAKIESKMKTNEKQPRKPGSQDRGQ
jgi:hypothetical protein